MYKLLIHSGSDNHGCEAIVRTTVELLDSPVVLYSRNPNSDYKYGLDHICNVKLDDRKMIKRGGLEWFLSSMQTKLTGKINWAVKYQYRNLIEDISSEDICFSIGGDNYCYPGTDILAAINQNIKYKAAKLVLWGCSVEPILLQKPEIVEDLSAFDLVTARESITYNALKCINKNTVLVADPAFILKPKRTSLPEHWLPNNMIGINASPLILQSGENEELVYRAYKLLIEEIIERTTFGIALIPHVVCDGNNDLLVLKRLYDDYKDEERILLINDCNCKELKWYISQCRMFIGARTHATIAAYSSCVPTIVLGYSVKSRGIAKDIFGTEENYVVPAQSLKDPSELTDHFRWLQSHEIEIRKYLSKKMPEYILKAYRGKEAVKTLISNSKCEINRL